MRRFALAILFCLALTGAGASSALADDPVPAADAPVAAPVPPPVDPDFPQIAMPKAPISLVPEGLDPWALRDGERRAEAELEAQRAATERRRELAERRQRRYAATHLPPGVRIAGVAVGDLSLYDAFRAVRRSFTQPLELRVGDDVRRVDPRRLGGLAYIKQAVKRAHASSPNSAVPLPLRVRGDDVRAWVGDLAERFDREPVDSALKFRNAKPVILDGQAGRKLDRGAATEAIVRALTGGERQAELPFKELPPRVSADSFGPVVVIMRGSNKLLLYDGTKLVRTFGVATGQSVYPTPLGRYSIAIMARNPWWTPPSSDWAKGLEPVPPGPGNPLGTRWMGITSPGVGIHGTPDASSIGYSRSHGCIRMRISEAEWLFEHVDIGTTVYIVRA